MYTEAKITEHMKMQKFVVFAKKRLKINRLKIKSIVKLDHCHYTGEYRGPAHSICNLKYSVHIETAIVFHNRLNYNYNFIIKELAEEFERQFS